MRSHDLTVSALKCPLRRGLDDAHDLEPRLEQIRLTMALAFELGPRLVIIQAGRIPEQTSRNRQGTVEAVSPLPDGRDSLAEKEDPRVALMKDSLEALGKHGDRTGVIVALDTGHDEPATLVAYLDRFDVGSLAVNFNPANLIMNGFNPYAAVRTFGRRLAHAHAQDARRTSPSKLATVALGHGDIDWMQLLANFEEIEYRGALTVLGADQAELAAGVSFLRRFVV